MSGRVEAGVEVELGSSGNELDSRHDVLKAA